MCTTSSFLLKYLLQFGPDVIWGKVGFGGDCGDVQGRLSGAPHIQCSCRMCSTWCLPQTMKQKSTRCEPLLPLAYGATFIQADAHGEELL
jgi:hypothetical protein